MKIELTKDEALFIAGALKAYAVTSLETRKPGELMAIEMKGRKLCSKLSRMEAKNNKDTLEIEREFLAARQEFCGIGEDETL